FKTEGNLTIPHSRLSLRLTGYLQQLHETEPDILRDEADSYLAGWSMGDTRWLRRYFDARHAESVYQLTPHTEPVLKFLAEVLYRYFGFIGTEWRLSRIIDTLSELVVRGSDDRGQRLESLRREREQLDREIASLEAGDTVETLSST